MAIQKILLAYNFTSRDRKAMDFVTSAFAHIEGVEITVFHAFTPVPDIETEASLVTGKLKGSLSFLSQQIMQREMTSKRSPRNLPKTDLRPNAFTQFSGPGKRISPAKLSTLPGKRILTRLFSTAKQPA